MGGIEIKRGECGSSAGDCGQGIAPAPSRLLVACLAASLALHAFVVLVLPGWQQEGIVPPQPVLDVVIAPQPPEATPAMPVPAPPKPALREPVRPPTPVAMAQPVPAAAPVFTLPVEPPRPAAEPAPAVETRAVAATAVPAEPVTPPAFNAAYLRNPPPRYPLAARRNSEEGTVMLRVLVNPEGTPVRVELDRTSGSVPLDSAATDAVRNWRFVPARRGSQNIEGWVRVPIVFKLEGLS